MLNAYKFRHHEEERRRWHYTES